MAGLVTPNKSNNQIDWLSASESVRYCLLNGASGTGVDIFSSLRLHSPSSSPSSSSSSSQVLVYLDQRKRVATNTVTMFNANTLLRAMEKFIPPDHQCVMGVFSLLASCRLEPNCPDLQQDSFVLSYSQLFQFLGMLSTHPACSPCINVNYDNRSSLRLLKSSSSIIEKIVRKRNWERFDSVDEFKKFCDKEGAPLSEEDEERVVVSDFEPRKRRKIEGK